jgi:DNA-binding transcriptional ArsR family regulator
MVKWSFLTNHARALVCIAHDPGVRLRDIAAALGITERSAYTIVAELADAGYVVKEKDGRRSRYEIQGHLPLRGSIGRERAVGEILDVLVEVSPNDPDAPTHEPDASSPHDRPWWQRTTQAARPPANRAGPASPN